MTILENLETELNLEQNLEDLGLVYEKMRLFLKKLKTIKIVFYRK